MILGIEKFVILLFNIILFFVMIFELKYLLIVLEGKGVYIKDEVLLINFIVKDDYVFKIRVRMC